MKMALDEAKRMQIVINIPYQIYEASQILEVKHEDVIQIPLECIAKGIPLPEGHGRLIDADAFIKTLEDVPSWLTVDDVFKTVIASLQNEAPTIIEADKAK